MGCRDSGPTNWGPAAAPYRSRKATGRCCAEVWALITRKKLKTETLLK